MSEAIPALPDVLIVTPWFPNVRNGWPSHFIADSAIGLSAAGWRTRVLVARPWYPAVLEKFVGVMHRGAIRYSDFTEIERLWTVRYLTTKGGLTRRLANLLLDARLKDVVRKEIEARRPDALHIHTEQLAPALVAVAKEYGIACVVTLHGENTNRCYIDSPFQRERFQRALGACDEIVIVGEPLRAYAETLSGRVDRICYIPNGVNADVPMRVVPAEDFEPVKLIAVSNLQEGKGLDLAIAALAALKAEAVENWSFTIVGEGPQRAELERQIADAKLTDHVILAGARPNTEVLQDLANADIFLLPSYREAFGIAYLEAMAAGLATIGVAGQGPAQFIDHGRTGYLTPPNDPGAIADLLRNLLRGDRRPWREVAAHGQASVVRRFSWSAHGAALGARLLEVSRRAGVGVEFERSLMRAPRVIMVRIEATPYVVGQLNLLQKLWPTRLDVLFLAQNLTQDWGLALPAAPRCVVLGPRKLDAIRDIFRRLTREPPELVQVAGWGNPVCAATILLARLKGIPVVVDTDTSRGGSGRARELVKQVVLRLALRLVTHFAAGGKRQIAYLRSYGVPELKATPVNMTVDVAAMMDFMASEGKAARVAVRASLHIREADLAILFVGRLVPGKGIADLVRAFDALSATYPRVHLLFVGDGPLASAVVEAREKYPRIHWTGRLAGKDLWRTYAAADVFVGTSTNENWGLVVNEAMAAGLPCIVSDCFGCIDDLVQEGVTGLVYASGDSAALERALDRLIANDEERAEMGARGRDLIATWTLESQATRVVGIWKRTIRADEE